MPIISSPCIHKVFIQNGTIETISMLIYNTRKKLYYMTIYITTNLNQDINKSRFQHSNSIQPEDFQIL